MPESSGSSSCCAGAMGRRANGSMKISCSCLQWRCSAAAQGAQTAPEEAKTREPQRIGEESSERLEYVPTSWHVIEEACQKHACPQGCAALTAPHASRFEEQDLMGLESGGEDDVDDPEWV